MYFRKFPHPSNFDYARDAANGAVRVGKARLRALCDRYDGDVFRLRVSGAWPRSPSIAGLTPPRRTAWERGAIRADLDAHLALTLTAPDGTRLLSAPAGRAFGVSGTGSLFLFHLHENDRFYGMGEKLLGLELSGRQSKFWNTDVFADFHWKEVIEDRPDPLYASIPYLIIRRGAHWLGLLLDNPHAAFISTGASVKIGGGQMDLGASERVIAIGAENGEPDLYILVADSLAALTRKLQHLVGRTPVPPAWALGYHQCRWGYQSDRDMADLDRNFRKHRIPCDGLWIDIDYMDAFKVFTFNKKHFPRLRKTLSDLDKRGRKLIPILDPGVKQQPGYNVYDDGRAHDIFCRNPQGSEFVGQVWPGDTVFPDFSLPEGRAWWAAWVKKFAAAGIRGAWIDMNDPSTGVVQNDAMRFQRGRADHDVFHNQYALGMAIATRAGFAAAHPGKRPFVISRSGYTGMSRHSAIWTGDNVSNYHYLRLAIPCSINLALSGVPFNGPDVGGFANDTNPQLLADWQKACFLFPFCRNHSATGTRRQEPWAFDARTLDICRHYIQLRYKLRPYLYNLFIRQAEHGDAILRPLFHDFENTEALNLDRVDDQFLIGPAILQAPILDEKNRTRHVILPGTQHWWSALDAKWMRGNRRIPAAPGPKQTPLYVREGQIVPMAGGLPETNRWTPNRIEAHVFLRNTSGASAETVYTFDDGDTENAPRSTVALTARVVRGTLALETKTLQNDFGPCRVRFVLYDVFKRVTLNARPLALRRGAWTFCGTPQRVWISG